MSGKAAGPAYGWRRSAGAHDILTCRSSAAGGTRQRPFDPLGTGNATALNRDLENVGTAFMRPSDNNRQALILDGNLFVSSGAGPDRLPGGRRIAHDRFADPGGPHEGSVTAK